MANYDFSDSQRETIWKNFHGNASSARDPFGRLMNKNNFECDHIYPKAKGGRTIVDNGMPLHPNSNLEKSDNIHGTVNYKKFVVKYDNLYDSGILFVNGERIN